MLGARNAVQRAPASGLIVELAAGIAGPEEVLVEGVVVAGDAEVVAVAGEVVERAAANSWSAASVNGVSPQLGKIQRKDAKVLACNAAWRSAALACDAARRSTALAASKSTSTG